MYSISVGTVVLFSSSSCVEEMSIELPPMLSPIVQEQQLRLVDGDSSLPSDSVMISTADGVFVDSIAVASTCTNRMGRGCWGGRIRPPRRTRSAANAIQ